MYSHASISFWGMQIFRIKKEKKIKVEVVVAFDPPRRITPCVRYAHTLRNSKGGYRREGGIFIGKPFLKKVSCSFGWLGGRVNILGLQNLYYKNWRYNGCMNILKKQPQRNNLLSDDDYLTPAAIAELEELRRWPFVEFDFARELRLIAEEYAQEEEQRTRKTQKNPHISYV